MRWLLEPGGRETVNTVLGLAVLGGERVLYRKADSSMSPWLEIACFILRKELLAMPARQKGAAVGGMREEGCCILRTMHDIMAGSMFDERGHWHPSSSETEWMRELQLSRWRRLGDETAFVLSQMRALSLALGSLGPA